MPGQSTPGMAGILPEPSRAMPRAVPSSVDALVKLPPQVLQQMYQNPPEGVPLYAIISARDKQMKDAQLRQAQQTQQAQQQLAGQQSTVADSVMGTRTVYAAGGGEMRVQGFQAGGAPRADTLFSVDGVPIYKPREGPERGESREEYEARKQREAEEADEVANRPLRRAFRAVTDYLSTPANERLPILDALTSGRSRGLPAAQAAQQAAPAVSRVAQRRAQLVSGRRGQAAAPLEEPPPPAQTPPPPGGGLASASKPPPAQTPPAAGQTVPAYDNKALLEALSATGQIPPEILEERKALAAARQAQLARQQAAAERYAKQLEESPDDRRMRAFAAIAEGLSSSPRLGKGLSAALSGLVKSETDARRARREGMKEVMTMEDAAANLQIAMQEQALADRTGDNKLKTAAAVAVAQAQRDFQKAMEEQSVARERAAAETLTAQARMKAAQPEGKAGTSTNAALAQRRLILENEIKRLEESADPLAPTTAAVKANARARADVLRRELLTLGGVAATAATGSQIREVLVIDPATGLLVPKPKP